MLSKNNFNERLRKMEPRKERFSIRKFTVGAASVLIGFTLFGMANNTTVKAATDNQSEVTASKQNETDVHKQNTEVQSESQEADGSATTDNSAEAAMGSATKNQPAEATHTGSETTRNQVTEQASASSQNNNANKQNDSNTKPASGQKATDVQNTNQLNINPPKKGDNTNPDSLKESKVATPYKAAAQQAMKLLAEQSKAKAATPQYKNEESVSDWQSFVSALSNTNVDAINITKDFNVAGKTTNIGGQSWGYNGCLTFDAENSARKVDINGNGNTIDFGHYSLMFENKNQNNGNGWDITFNNVILKGVEQDSQGKTSATEPGTFGLVSFSDVNAKNQAKNTVTFNNVTADVNGRPIIEGAKGNSVADPNKANEYYTVNFTGINKFTDAGHVANGVAVSDTGSAVEAGYVNFKSGSDTTIEMTSTGSAVHNYGGNVIRAVRNDVLKDSKQVVTADNLVTPTVNVEKGATVNIKGADNVRGIYAGENKLLTSQKGSVKVDGTLIMDMGAGHSTAINAANLLIGKSGKVNITTKQDNNQGLVGNLTFNGNHYGVIALGVGYLQSTYDADQNLLDDSGSLTVNRTTKQTLSAPLIAFGTGNYKLNVNEGATLNLMDAANQNSGDHAGMITMFGTSSTTGVNFTKAKYVNLQRTGSEAGNLLAIQGGHNNTTITQSPIAQWDEANISKTPSYTWIVDNVSSQNNWGATQSHGFTPANQNKQSGIVKAGVDKFLHSNGTVVMAPTQAGLNSFEYNGKQLPNKDSWQGTIVQGTPTDGSKYYQPYLVQFLNNFSYWTPQRLAMGTALLDNSEPSVKVKDTDKYQPETQTVNGYTDQKLSDLNANDGIKDYLENNGQTTTTVSKEIVNAKSVEWYNSATDKTEWDKVMVTPSSDDKTGDVTLIPIKEPQNPTGNLKTTDTSAWAKVTYQDGSVDFVNIPLNIRTQAEEYDPNGQNVNTTVGNEPAAKDGISNTDKLPSDANYNWVNTPDVSKPGVVPSIVKVTYDDGSQDQVPVNVVVKDNDGNVPTKTGDDAATNDPQGKEVSTTIGKMPNPGDAVQWPSGQPVDKDGKTPITPTYSWSTEPDIWTKGEHPGVVKVTYPDKTSDLVTTTVNVTNEPTGQDTTVKQGDALPDPGDTSVIDWGDGTKPTDPKVTYTWSTKPDTSTPGTKTGTVTITYPNGEKTTVQVPVHVTPNETTQGAYDPYAKNLNLPYSPTGDGVPEAGSVIVLPDGETAPAGVAYTWGTKPDTKKPGDQNATVVATYKDANVQTVTKNIPVNVHVGPMSDYYTPSATDLTVPYGADMTKDYPAKKQISGIPDNVQKDDRWAPMPVTIVSGTQPTMIKVIYTDGSFDYVPLNVTVLPKPSEDKDKDLYQPEYAPITVDQGHSASENPTWKDGKTPEYGNATFAKTDETPSWVTSIDSDGKVTVQPTDKVPAQRYIVPVQVTYKDNSSEIVNVLVDVKNPNKGEDTYYGDDTMTRLEAPVISYHKTSYDYNPSATDSGFTKITVFSDWDHKGYSDSNYKTKKIYNLSADGKTFVNKDNKSDTFAASDITYGWQTGLKGVSVPNTNVSNFNNGLADTTYAFPDHINTDEQTAQGDSLPGNSKWRITYTVNADAARKIGVRSYLSNWVNAYFNFYGATAKDDLTDKVGAPVPTDSDKILSYVNTDSLTKNGNLVNGNLTSATWAPGKEAGQDGKFVKGANKGTVRLVFNNDPNNYLDVDVTISTDTKTVSPTDPGVNPDQPDKQHSDLFLTVHRDVYVDGVKDDDLSQTIRYARDKQVDASDQNVVVSYGQWRIGQVENGKWVFTPDAKDEFAQEPAPTKSGYKTLVDGNESDTIPAAKVKMTTKTEPNGQLVATPQNGADVHVTYQPNPAADVTVSYQFYDITDKKNVDKPIPVTGKVGSTVQTGLKVPKGYKLAEGQTLPTTVTIPSKDQTIVINLVHDIQGIKPSDENPATKYITRIIKSEGLPDDLASQGIKKTQTVTFSRLDKEGNVGYTDPVTGEIKMNDWKPEGSSKWDSVPVAPITSTDGAVYSPTIDGKVVSEVPSVNVTSDTKNKTVTVVYKETTTPIKWDGTKDGMYKTVTRTINVYEISGEPTQIKQPVNFTRKDAKGNAGYIIDGKITMNEWHVDGSDAKTGKWAEYHVPQIQGYTSTVDIDAGDNGTTVIEKVVDPKTKDETVTVAYTKTYKPTDPSINPTDPGKNSDMYAHPTRTIIVNNPLTGNAETNTQTVWFGREKTVSTDPKIGTTYGAWQLGRVEGNKFVADKNAPSSWAKFEAPEFAGFTPSAVDQDGNKVDLPVPEVKVSEGQHDQTITITYTKNNNGGGDNGGGDNPTPKQGEVTIIYKDENGNEVGRTTIPGTEGSVIDPSGAIKGNVPSGYKIKDGYNVPTSASVSSSITVPVVKTSGDNGNPTNPGNNPGDNKKPDDNKPTDNNDNGGKKTNDNKGNKDNHKKNDEARGHNNKGRGNGSGSNNGQGLNSNGNGNNGNNAKANIETNNGNGEVKAATNGDKNVKTLPQTGEKTNNAGIFGLALASLASLLGLAGADKKRRDN